MKIGILGGSFNPIHKGHIHLAKTTKKIMDLDKILFIPLNQPCHKKQSSVITVKHRLNMISLAISGTDEFVLSNIDVKRGKTSYTIDSLKDLQKKYKKESLYYILGMDSFLTITTWKSYRRLFTMTNFIITDRPGIQQQYKFNQIIKQQGYTKTDIKSQKIKAVYKKKNLYLYLINCKNLNISASSCRKKIKNRTYLSSRLHPKVIAYIKKSGLYQ